MSATVSNNTLALQADVIFANSAAYHVALPLAGRATEREQIEGALESGGSQVVVVRAPLGAGKTFLLKAVIGDLAMSRPDFNERRDVVWRMATGFEPPNVESRVASPERLSQWHSDMASAAESIGQKSSGRNPKILVIEEIDRKATLDQVMWSVGVGLMWASQSADRVVVITGDRTLDLEVVAFLIDGEAERVTRVTLDPLDDQLMQEALESRILAKITGLADEDKRRAQSLAHDAARGVLSSDLVRWSAVPRTSTGGLANFRDGLGALRILSRAAPASDHRVDFPDRCVAKLAESGGPAATESPLTARVIDRVATSVKDGIPLTPMGVEELRSLAGDSGSTRFHRRVLHPMVQTGLLLPIGVPYTTEDDRGELDPFTEPFLPSYRIVHRALVKVLSER